MRSLLMSASGGMVSVNTVPSAAVATTVPPVTAMSALAAREVSGRTTTFKEAPYTLNERTTAKKKRPSRVMKRLLHLRGG